MEHKVDRETFGFIVMGSHRQFTINGDAGIQVGERIDVRCADINANLSAIATSITTKFAEDLTLEDAMWEGYYDLVDYRNQYVLHDDDFFTIIRFEPIGRS